MNLEKSEKETIINFDESSQIVNIYTCSKLVANKCKKAGYMPIEHDEVSWTFETNKRFISFRNCSSKKREVTEDQIDKMNEGKNK